MNIGLGLSHSYERVGLTTTLDNNGNVKFCGGGFDKFRHCYDAGGALDTILHLTFVDNFFLLNNVMKIYS